jgi:hypothetical protein
MDLTTCEKSYEKISETNISVTLVNEHFSYGYSEEHSITDVSVGEVSVVPNSVWVRSLSIVPLFN